MRIIAFTDIHGSYKKIYEILSKEADFHAIIIGGDLTTYGSPREAEDAIALFQTFKKPLFAVAGNMDPVEIEDSFEKLGVSINAKGIILDDVGFFGVSASPLSPLHTPYEITEEEILRRAEMGLKDVAGSAWKIFVPHAPPRDTKLDRIFTGIHVGSSAVRKFIEAHQPDVGVCGHIHEARGMDIIETTQMINCGPAGKGYYAVIEINEEVTVKMKEYH